MHLNYFSLCELRVLRDIIQCVILRHSRRISLFNEVRDCHPCFRRGRPTNAPRNDTLCQFLIRVIRIIRG